MNIRSWVVCEGQLLTMTEEIPEIDYVKKISISILRYDYCKKAYL